MLHESFDVFLDSVRVFGLGERLHEHALVLRFLELFNLFRVVIELLEELKCFVGMTVGSFKVVKQVL